MFRSPKAHSDTESGCKVTTFRRNSKIFQLFSFFNRPKSTKKHKKKPQNLDWLCMEEERS